ncbi:hypothetical protein CHL67_00075 [Prosthecochloris sp. GSB1]|nr:hypothetical protein CHL67_00075 [Prosthecochloris sp. GSB1]
MTCLAGCGGADGDVVARSGKLELTRGELLASISFDGASDSLAAASMYIEDWRDMAALYQRALVDGVEREPETKLLIEKASRQITVQRFIDRKITAASANGLFRIDSSEVSAFYERHADAFVCAEPHVALVRYYAASAVQAAKLRAIAVETGAACLPDSARDAVPEYAELNRKSFSAGRRLRRQSRLFLENGRMHSILREMTPGDVSRPIALNDSLIVVMQLLDRVETGGRMTLDQCRGDIEELLIVEKQKQYYTTLLETARETYQ